MKPFISTTFFGVLTYLVSLTLIASPWLFGLVDVSSAALFLPIYFGWLQLIMAIFSNNSTGFLKQFPMHTHMVLLTVMGFVLLVSPWLYTFADKACWPEVLFGALLLCMGIFTKGSPFTSGGAHHALPHGHEDSLRSRLSNF
jgi:hypothetical protein